MPTILADEFTRELSLLKDRRNLSQDEAIVGPCGAAIRNYPENATLEGFDCDFISWIENRVSFKECLLADGILYLVGSDRAPRLRRIPRRACAVRQSLNQSQDSFETWVPESHASELGFGWPLAAAESNRVPGVRNQLAYNSRGIAADSLDRAKKFINHSPCYEALPRLSSIERRPGAVQPIRLTYGRSDYDVRVQRKEHTYGPSCAGPIASPARNAVSLETSVSEPAKAFDSRR
jgi:hypothetical protein